MSSVYAKTDGIDSHELRKLGQEILEGASCIPDEDATKREDGPADAGARGNRPGCDSAEEECSESDADPADKGDQGIFSVGADVGLDPRSSALEYARLTRIAQEKLSMAEERAQELRESLVDEEHRDFARRKVRSHIEACVGDIRKLRNADAEMRLEEAAAEAGHVHKKGIGLVSSRGQTPLDLYDPDTYVRVWFWIFPYGDAAPDRSRPGPAVSFEQWRNYMYLREEMVYGGVVDAKAPWLPIKEEYASAKEYFEVNTYEDPAKHHDEGKAFAGPTRIRLAHELIATLRRHNVTSRMAKQVRTKVNSWIPT